MDGNSWDLSSQNVDLTLKLDKWLHYLSESRVESVAELTREVSNMSNHIMKTAGVITNYDKEKMRVDTICQGTAKEVFSRLYSSRELEPVADTGSGTELTKKAHEIISGLDEFESLRQQVNGDPDFCALSTSKLMKAINGALPAMIENMQQKAKEEQANKAKELLGLPPSPSKNGDAPNGEDGFRAAVRGACADAASEVSDVRSALAGISPGMEAAPPMFGQQDTKRLELARQLQNNDRLKKLMMLAGRLRRLAAAERKERDPDGVGVITGVTRGDDFMRMLPTEMAMLKVPQMRTYQLAKMAEKKMAQYQMEGEKKEGRGPIIVMLDTSSSMTNGDRAMWASAVAMSCISTARQEKRSCTILGFNRRVNFIYTIDGDGEAYSYPSPTELDKTVPVEGGALEVSLRMSKLQCSGGTNFDDPFVVALSLEFSFLAGRADLIMITDGEAEVSPEVYQSLVDAKEQSGLRVYGLTVGGGSFNKVMHEVCDNIVDIGALANEKEVASALP